MSAGPPRWTLGLYAGPSPLALAPVPGVNPILSRWDVTDFAADFVADPFLLHHGERWFLYSEVLPSASQKGEIGLAVSTDCRRFHYQGTVLAEPFHLSYPLVFTRGGVIYLLPETLHAEAVRLYRASTPEGPFTPVADLIPGRFADPTLFRHGARWWLFACSAPERHDTLDLYFADALLGPWRRHPASPIIRGDPRVARPAGRTVEYAGRLFRFTQDCDGRYGQRVRGFEILTLTPTGYRERELATGSVLEPSGAGWNSDRMHHLDAHQLADGSWLAVVDGYDSSPAARILF